MRANSVVIRAVMHTQFIELKRAGGTHALTPEEHYPFVVEEVEEIFFNRGGVGKGVWFLLKDGRTFDVRGEVAAAVPRAPQQAVDAVSDQDALDTLALSTIPLSSATLRAARLVKNARLETAVELHNDAISGSLQMRPEDVLESFPRHPEDHRIIGDLAQLPSYDVYALRRSLRKIGLPVDDKTLQLSDPLKQRLERFSQEFTHPLLRAVYGRTSEDGDHNLIHMFRAPDKALVASRLKAMSEKTGIPIEEIPEFLETYSDLFMSVIYYRQNFERTAPHLDRCSIWLRDLQIHREGGVSTHAAFLSRKVDEALHYLAASIRERLSAFRRAFDVFWRDMNRETLERLRREIEERHVGTGGLLCGLTIKMRHWSHTFRTSDSGGPATRAQYVTSEMEPGLERLCRMF